MCGIAGIVAPSQAAIEIRSIVQRMTDVVTHRGPDDEGHYVEDGVAIGMRRLSIIDVAGGQQPISNETGEIAVVCNGEIYNFGELRRQLESRGHVFKSGSDAEVIVHLYEDLGDECFRELRGMFGIAIWDRRHRRLVLGRDRLGKKPLFYAHRSGQFLFGSEIKSLLAAAPALAEPDYRTLPQFLQFSYIHEPDTIYRHVKKLRAGHCAVFEQGQFTMRPYWTLRFAPRHDRTAEEFAERLDCLLEECVRTRLHSEVPLGIFLSGGLDSSAVLAYAHKAGLRPLKTFTIGFDRPEWDESPDAQRVAEHFHTEHHVLHLSESDLQRTLPDTLIDLVRHCDEPFGDDSALPSYHVSKLAREHVSVILSGDGGDELFGGYSSYLGARFACEYRRRLPQWLGRSVLPNVALATARALPARFRYPTLRVAKVLRDSALPFEQAYRDKTSIWRHLELQELLSPCSEARAAASSDQYLPDDLWQTLRCERDIVSRLTDIDIRSYLLDDILVKVDRMSMAHSLEVRSPLLDHHLVEFAASLPTELKIQGWKGKVILRDVVSRYLPACTLRKRKQGFSVPLRDWLRHGLSDMVGDYLEYGGGRLPDAIFSRKKVQQTLDEHRRGYADHGRKIWLLLVFAAWHENYQTGGLPQCVASLAS